MTPTHIIATLFPDMVDIAGSMEAKNCLAPDAAAGTAKRPGKCLGGYTARNSGKGFGQNYIFSVSM